MNDVCPQLNQAEVIHLPEVIGMNEKHPYYRRKTPQELLDEIAEAKRGKLKLYVGAAPGVGKSFKMLQDAHDMKIEGIDVVIGLIETHGRKETEDLIKDIEIIPLKTMQYKGSMFRELNLNEIIERKPNTVVIDELAHTNIPGSKNKKRYIDIEERYCKSASYHANPAGAISENEMGRNQKGFNC